MTNLEVVNKATGEILSFGWQTDAEMAAAYDNIRQTIEALEQAKNKIRDKVLDAMTGDSLEVGNYNWRRQTRRYFNYDLTTMRNTLDEDLYNQLVKPDKAKLDFMIKESISEPGNLTPDQCSELRATMLEERKPSIALVLEKVKA